MGKKLKDVMTLEQWNQAFALLLVLGVLPEISGDGNDHNVYGTMYMVRSGHKEVGPWVSTFSGMSGESSEIVDGLMTVIGFKYKVNWAMYARTLNLEDAYNPIHNYDMSETVNRELTGNGTENSGYTDNNTQTTTNGSGEEAFAYGFNNTNPDGNQTDRYTTENETSVEGTYTNTAQSSQTELENETKTTVRSGNIGVTTSQQMIESELELRKRSFMDLVFADLDKEFCLKVYDPCAFKI